MPGISSNVVWGPRAGIIFQKMIPARGPQTTIFRQLRYPGLGTLATSNPGIQAIGSWARYPGLGTLATSNPGIQAIGSWARYPGLGTLAMGANPGSHGALAYNTSKNPSAATALFGEIQAIGSWARQVYASLGKSATTGNPDLQTIGSWARQV